MFKGLVLFFIVLPLVAGSCIVAFLAIVSHFSHVSAERADKSRQAYENRALMEAAAKEKQAAMATAAKAKEDADIRESLRIDREAYERSPARLAERAQDDAARLEAERIKNEEKPAQKAKDKVERESPSRVRQAKIAAYQLAQASNGSPSFQIEVAKRYMRGDGLPLDKQLARYWLASACTNHESQATNLLKELAR